MFWWMVFFVTALLAALAGFGGIARGTTGLAPALYLVFIGVFVASLIWGLTPYHHKRKLPPA
jgi:uncharacterized membrane protein YtjA (UPF0391 family)